ncbi:MAG: cardiolipin synthase [Eubacteriales bacterium]|nr:cardiolipin synthase [Eubacteriales bacterium]
MDSFLHIAGLVWHFMHEVMIYLNIIIIFLIIFFQKRDPVAIFLWIVVLILAPVAGFVLYIFLGQQIHKEKLFKVKGMEDTINKYIRRDARMSISDRIRLSKPRMRDFEELIKYNRNVAQIAYTENNAVEVYFDGREKFRALVKALESAQHYIYFQYYIIRDDEVFGKIKPILIEKARAGLKVCIIYDGMGCRMMKKKVWRDLAREGIESVAFFPAIFGPLNFRVNYRNHRKIVVIDGRTAFMGGFNVGREYVGMDRRFGYWRDTHIQLTGDAVVPIEMRFIMDWNYAVKDKKRQLRLGKPRIFPIAEESTGVQIVSSGPDLTEPLIRDNFIKMIATAKDNIRIQTPYFIPDESIMTALKIALHSGVAVEIIIPAIPDHPVVLSATRYFAGLLVEEGARLYEYRRGFVHAKVITVDNMVCSVGTANMDIRSFRLNFEINAVIFSESVTGKINAAMDKDKEYSTEITIDKYRERSIFRRFKERFARLFSPLL